MLDARVTVDSSGLSALPERIEWALQRFAERAAQEIARDQRQTAPTAFSTMVNSIKADEISALEWWIGPHVAYAGAVEEGRDPGRMPPLQSIIDWVKVKRLAEPDEIVKTARALQHVIGYSGTQAHPFIAPSAERFRDRAPSLAERYLRKI